MSEQDKENLTPESPTEEKAEGEVPAEKAEGEAPAEKAEGEAPAEKAEGEAPAEEAAASAADADAPAEGALPAKPDSAAEASSAPDDSTSETSATVATVATVETAEATEGTEAPTPAPEPQPTVSYEPEGAGPYYGTGRRKTAIARVYLTQGSGQVTVNGRAFEQFFVSELWRRQALEPLKKFGLMEKFDVKVSVEGGGSTGQSGAIQLGIARALLIAIPDIKRDLRTSGFLTRDSRKRERKKYGQKGARRRFQWTKR